ncbi:MAG: TraR/DksA family transcriptional regulator [Candidatus Binatia bacterium]
MNAIKHENYYDQLKKRRNQIIMTLEHVQKEQRAVEENKDRIDRAAFESRVHLLDNLTDWYANETARIDEALIRIAEGKYGVCVGCQEPIDARRLETTPAAIFCAPCQAMREELSPA